MATTKALGTPSPANRVVRTLVFCHKGNAASLMTAQEELWDRADLAGMVARWYLEQINYSLWAIKGILHEHLAWVRGFKMKVVHLINAFQCRFVGKFLKKSTPVIHGHYNITTL